MTIQMVLSFARIAVLTVLTVFTLAPAVYAHGQFDVMEIGPPLAASAILGVASYWLVMLWPLKRRVRGRTARGRRRRSRARISLVA